MEPLVCIFDAILRTAWGLYRLYIAPLVLCFAQSPTDGIRDFQDRFFATQNDFSLFKQKFIKSSPF